MNQIKLLNCVCKSEYQDKNYSGKRVHNKCNSKTNSYKCTVCGKINTSGVEK